MTDFYSQNRCVCSTRSHGPLLCAFCLSFHFNASNKLLLYNSFITCYFNYCCVYGVSAIHLILLKYKNCKRKLRYSMLDFKSSYKQLLHNCGLFYF